MLKNTKTKYIYNNLRSEIIRAGFNKEDEFAECIEMKPRTLKSRLMGKTPFNIDEIKVISFKLKEITGADERKDFKYLFKVEGEI